jgi:hypothetical protein
MSETTYIYFEILLICGLAAWKESITVVDETIVGTSSLILRRRGVVCDTSSVSVLVGLILHWRGQVCRRIARVDFIRLIRRHDCPICPVGSRLCRAVPRADR